MEMEFAFVSTFTSFKKRYFAILGQTSLKLDFFKTSLTYSKSKLKPPSEVLLIII